ncbi:MAG: copper chaperone PCu(A)C [Alphaproteobacteria bacterium]|nr:copper chaperone PCu(A)C [Alphaproteobacteria bacterium]TAD90036.1 MAG: copper chaperone PCu(A)C [Alphaproteobacteria bacterium]
MLRRTALALAGLPLLLFSGLSGALHAHEHEVRVGDLVITQPWSRATPPGARVGGGYLQVRNTGSAPDRLLSGTMAVAGRVEIHEMRMDGQVMRMRALEQGLVIPPGRTVELRPGGYHVMFMELQRPLVSGETVVGTLVFERAGQVQVQYRVGAAGAGPDGQPHRH